MPPFFEGLAPRLSDLVQQKQLRIRSPVVNKILFFVCWLAWHSQGPRHQVPRLLCGLRPPAAEVLRLVPLLATSAGFGGSAAGRRPLGDLSR